MPDSPPPTHPCSRHRAPQQPLSHCRQQSLGEHRVRWQTSWHRENPARTSRQMRQCQAVSAQRRRAVAEIELPSTSTHRSPSPRLLPTLSPHVTLRRAGRQPSHEHGSHGTGEEGLHATADVHLPVHCHPPRTLLRSLIPPSSRGNVQATPLLTLPLQDLHSWPSMAAFDENSLLF